MDIKWRTVTSQITLSERMVKVLLKLAPKDTPTTPILPGIAKGWDASHEMASWIDEVSDKNEKVHTVM